MRIKFKDFTVAERDLLAVMRSEGKSIREIARKLKRSPSSISRELQRNSPPIRTVYYLSHKEHERTVNRNRESNQRFRLKKPEIRR